MLPNCLGSMRGIFILKNSLFKSIFKNLKFRKIYIIFEICLNTQQWKFLGKFLSYDFEGP